MNILSIILAAVIPITATTQATKSVNISAYHGESVTFETTYLDASNNPIEDISVEELYFQTNGMGQIWFKAKSPNSFNPSDDIGAANYRFFLRAESPDGVNYRANGNLRMLDSPGFTPAELSLPAKSIDFSIIDVKNAPWALEEELISVSNSLQEATQDIRKDLDAAANTANDAMNTATNAQASADSANATATNALSLAKSADSWADYAYSRANNAYSRADDAYSWANDAMKIVRSAEDKVAQVMYTLESGEVRIMVNTNDVESSYLSIDIDYSVDGTQTWQTVWAETNTLSRTQKDNDKRYFLKSEAIRIDNVDIEGTNYTGRVGEINGVKVLVLE